MPYSHHNTMVKGEEFSPTPHLTFQKNHKKTSSLFKGIIIFFILLIIFSSTIFLVHYFAQKLNLDQDYSKLISSKLYVPSFSSFRNSDHSTASKKNDLTYSDLSHSSSQPDSDLSKFTIDVQPSYKTSKSTKKKKNLSTISFDVPNNQFKTNNNKSTFSFSQFWNYFKTENFHLYSKRVQKTDILNEDLRQVFLKVHNFATLKGLKLTEFGNRIYKFLGIPYAQPPIGNLRFNEPLEYKPSNEGVIDNTKFGPICPQFFDEVLVKTVTPLTRNMSEDCLTLNVWSPKLSKDSLVKYSDKESDSKSSSPLWTILNEDTLDFEDDNKNSSNQKVVSNTDKTKEELLPVMVWIHGGGFSMGSTALDEYDGSILSSFGNVVVVTINYRLGVFGFFNLNSPQATGNQGLKDQILALKWVKKNIKNFGGDPEKITIFGQSAGGFAVGLHMISPNSKGLFRRAILQSGSPVVFDQFYSNTYNIAKRLVHFVKCDENEEQEGNLPNASTEPTNVENEEGAEDESEEEDDKDKIKDKSVENNENDKEDTNLKPSANEKDEELTSDKRLRLKRNSEDDEGEDDGEEEETTEKTKLDKIIDESETEIKRTNLNNSVSLPEKSSDSSVNETFSEDNNEEKNEKTETSSVPSSTLSPSTTIKTTVSQDLIKENDSKKLKLLVPNLNIHSTSSEKKSKSLENLFKETNENKSDKVLKCMQSKSMKVLIRAQKNAMQNSMYPFSPNKHESILPKMPAEIIKQDISSNYFHLDIEQILLGINKDEGSLYLHLTMPQVFPSENLTLNINRLSELRRMLANNLTNAFKVPRSQATIVANLLLNNGPEIDTTENLVKKYYQLIADLMFNCPTVMLADELVKLNYENDKKSLPKKKQVYFYRFNERPSVTNWGEWMGITHHEEVQFVFGMPLKYPLKYNSKDLIFSKRIMKTWAHFANTGEMLPQLDLQWPAYNKHQQLMELNAFESKLTEKLHEKNCNLFRIGFESFMRRKRYVL